MSHRTDYIYTVVVISASGQAWFRASEKARGGRGKLFQLSQVAFKPQSIPTRTATRSETLEDTTIPRTWLLS